MFFLSFHIGDIYHFIYEMIWYIIYHYAFLSSSVPSHCSWIVIVLILNLDVRVDVDHQSDSTDHNAFDFFTQTFAFYSSTWRMQQARSPWILPSGEEGGPPTPLPCKPARIVGKHGLGQIFETAFPLLLARKLNHITREVWTSQQGPI